MKIRWSALWIFVGVLGLLAVTPLSQAQTASSHQADEQSEQEAPISVAVLPFAFSGEDFEDIAAELPTLLTAMLSSQPSLLMVERAEVDKALSEIELGASGTVDPQSAARVGFLTGAQVLVTGRAFPVQREIVVVAKVIGVETGRVYGDTIAFPARGSIVEAAQELASKIGTAMAERGPTLVAPEEEKEDFYTQLRKEVDGKDLPSVSISIPEMNLDRQSIDPAAETEIAFILQQLGFEIIDPVASNRSADVEITGEALSQFGLRRGNLVSSRGRVEIKATSRRAGKVLLISRDVSVAVDISPAMAGKAAIAKSAAKLTASLVPVLVAADFN